MIKVKIKESDIRCADREGGDPFEAAVARILNVDLYCVESLLGNVKVFDDADDIVASYKMTDDDFAIVQDMVETWNYGDFTDYDWKSFQIKLKKN